jgi:hypothetical protein
MKMAISTLELTRVRESVCPHCGHPVDSPHRVSWIEAGLGILAAVALALLLVPLGIMAWKSCRDFLSDRDSHSILYHPLEDWTRDY